MAKRSPFTRIGPDVQYITSLADFVRRDADGKVLVDSREIDIPGDTPLVWWSEPVPPHTLENVGDHVIHAIVIELKHQSSGPES